MSGAQGTLGMLMDKLKQSAPNEDQKKPEEQSADMSDKVVWEPAEAADRYDIRLAEGSIRPMSESALRSQIIELKKVGMIDVAHALEILDIPDWEEIAEAVQKEMELAALAKVGRK
jgi:hypothetical protein